MNHRETKIKDLSVNNEVNRMFYLENINI